MRQAVTGINSPQATALLLNSLPVTAAAKTGTAETYKENYYHNWITAFAPYEDIILDENATKEWKQVNIRSPHTYKELLVRSRQVYGNTRPISVAAVVENALGFALSRAGWMQVVKARYPNVGEDSDA